MTQFFRPALFVAGVAAIGLAGCQKEAAKPDTSAIVAALKAQEMQWNADYKAKDVAKIVAHYAPDAVLMTPGEPSAGTAEAIKASISALTADPALDLRFEADKVGVAAAGDMAYTRGHFTLTVTDPVTKKPSTQTGSYLTVYEKQADGSWKAVEDIASPGAQAPTAPPPAPPPT